MISGVSVNSDQQSMQHHRSLDCQFRHRPRLVVPHRHEGRVVAPRASTTAKHGARVDACEEGARAVSAEQGRGVDRKHARRWCGRLGAAACPQPCAGTDKTVPPPRLRPEEHMCIDMPPPCIRPAGEAASQRGGEGLIRHQLRAQNGGLAPAWLDPLKRVAVGPIGHEPGKSVEFSGRQQTGCRQPRAGTFRLDDVPDARVASGEARRSVAQAIPSTSIME